MVGAILLADTFVIAMLHWLGGAIARIFGVAAPAWAAARQSSGALSEIWQKLSARQKAVGRTLRQKEESEVVEAITVEEPAVAVNEQADNSIENMADTEDAEDTDEEKMKLESKPVVDEEQKKMAIRLTMPQIRKPAQPVCAQDL